MSKLTREMLDARRTNIPRALEAARLMQAVAPCFYVKGNHEARIPDYPLLEEGTQVIQLLMKQLKGDC